MRKRMSRMHLASFDNEAYKTGGERRGIKSRRTMYLSPLQLEECFFSLFKTRSLLKSKEGLKTATEIELLFLMRVFSKLAYLLSFSLETARCALVANALRYKMAFEQ